ncbi:hypothetical protein CASFOL_018237 [Castilleja foliolosa]|uniref:Bifunctional inhibitor/plant lipid transfer protein/seed storage helical domain-containing protein n=1 Tax=Castilleja foliolosa TaxID=1961234 RepID=A0ABD3D975_9LAMI
MIKKGSSVSVAAWCLVVLVVVLTVEVQEMAAVTCDPVKLSPCLDALTGSGKPSSECCKNLKEQEPCFCEYIRNPAFKPYIDTPKAREVAQTCGVSYPKC